MDTEKLIAWLRKNIEIDTDGDWRIWGEDEISGDFDFIFTPAFEGREHLQLRALALFIKRAVEEVA